MTETKKRGRPSKTEKAIKKGNQKTLEFYIGEKYISINEIQIGERKRSQYNENKINELAVSIEEIGLMNPILISKDNTLIAGYHRILAFKKLGKDKIPYRMTTIEDPLKHELQEIDENLIRGDLIALEECEQIYRRKLIYEELNPGAKYRTSQAVGMHKKLGHNVDDSLSSTSTKAFSQEIADKIGKSQRTIQRYTRIARDIIEELRDMIRDTEIAKRFNELGKIAKLSKDGQEELISIIDTMKRSPDLKISNIKNLTQIKERQILYKKEAEKKRMDPVEDHFVRKIIKYENQIKNFLFSGKDGKDPYGLWKELTSTNDKRWEKGKCYTYTYCHLKKLNLDVLTKKELNLSNFTLHHQPYEWKNMLTKQAFPMNAYKHPKGRISELEGKEWDLFRGGFIKDLNKIALELDVEKLHEEELENNEV